MSTWFPYEAEISYRHEQIAADFDRVRTVRQGARRPRLRWTVAPWHRHVHQLSH